MLTTVKGEIDSNTIIVGDFNTPLIDHPTPIDRSSKQKRNMEIQALNDTRDQTDLIDIIEHSTQTWQNTLASQAHMEHSPG